MPAARSDTMAVSTATGRSRVAHRQPANPPAPSTAMTPIHATQREPPRRSGSRSMRSAASSSLSSGIGAVQKKTGRSGPAVEDQIVDLQIADRRCLTFLFVLFFLWRAEPRRGSKRLAVVEEREIAHVERLRAGRRLLVDNDGDRTALDAFAKGDTASTGEPRVRESFQHLPVIISLDIFESRRRKEHGFSLGAGSCPVWAGQSRSTPRYNNALISLSNVSFFPIPTCFEQILPSREIITVTGRPTIGPYASCTLSLPSPCRTG